MKKSDDISLKYLLLLEKLVSYHSHQIDVSKLAYRKLSQSAKRKLQKQSDRFCIASTQSLYTNTVIKTELQTFIASLLSPILDMSLLKVSFPDASNNTKEFISYILEDRSFKNHIIYSLMNEKPNNIIGSNIISLLFLYIFKNQKMTISRIKDFLSMYIVKSGVNLEVFSSLTSKQRVMLNQIKTGIKEEKIIF